MASHVLSYTVLFLLWICCAAQNEKIGCGQPPRKDHEELVASSRKPSYADGDEVQYNCRPGYIKIGRIRYRCSNGKWIPASATTECRNKPCGHPGDIEFGSFELVKGTEFTYGARVEFRCNEGYKMLSQTNYRNCLVEGWSNAVPHCEVMKCFPVKPPENGRIIMTGIQDIDQDFLFGQVLRFECLENFKLEGSEQISCGPDGEWNEPVPKCVEISCKPEIIDHGYILFQKNIYKEGERVQFACEAGYTHAERSDSQCTKNGWSSRLACIEIKCYPPQIANGNFHPVQNLYEYEDTIQTSCEEGYQIQGGEKTSKCTETGWLPIPRCIPKTCDYIRIPNGRLSNSYERYRNYYFPRSVGQTIDYECFDGYLAVNKQRQDQAVCTKFGYSPQPKCSRQCDIRSLPNGRFNALYWHKFVEGEETTFQCNQGFAPRHEQTTITCTKEGWSPAPSCILQGSCAATAPNNGFLTVRRSYFTLNEQTTYGCHSGFTTPKGLDRGRIRCLERGWEPKPKCLQACQVQFGENIVFESSKKVLFVGETLHYECKEGLETDQKTIDGKTECTENGWQPNPSCFPIRCEPVSPEHGIHWARDGEYLHGNVVTFSCSREYIRVGPESAQCYEFGWSPPPPKCKVKTEVKSCQPPPGIADGSINNDKSEAYNHSHKVEYICNLGYALVGSKEIECVDGEWTSLPTCSEQHKCGSPPNVTKGHPINVDSEQYLHGETVTYECEGKPNTKEKDATCIDGQWKLPSCSDSRANCNHPENTEIVFKEYRREEYRHGTTATYDCGSRTLSTECVSGKWVPEPVCTESCPPPPQIPNAINIFQVRNYESGEEVSFKCEQHFLLKGPPKIRCEDGKWQTPPRCMDTRCEVPPVLPHSTLKNIAGGKYLPGDRVTYDCIEGYEISGTKFITCENRKWSQPPSCEEKSCGEPPLVFEASFDKAIKKKYQPGETVTYTCHLGFVAKGQTKMTCQRGKWSNSSSCEDAVCRNTPIVANADIVEGMANLYLPGQQVIFQCHEGFVMSGPATVTCENKMWSELPKCKDATCSLPPRISNGEVKGPPKQRYLPLEKVRYQCFRGYSLVGPYSVTCENKQWTEAPQCRDLGGRCGYPPVIENGDVSSDFQPAYESGTVVRYQCQNLYRMEGDPRVQCVNGHWTDAPRCIDPCTATIEEMERNNIQLRWRRKQKLYSESGDQIEFICKRGYILDPSSPPLRTHCIQGVLPYPRCIQEKKGENQGWQEPNGAQGRQA